MVKLTDISLLEQQKTWQISSNLTEKRVKNVKQSAVSDHLLQCDCSINFDNFDILPSETNNFRLLIKESLLIMREKPVLNRTTTSFPLKLFD